MPYNYAPAFNPPIQEAPAQQTIKEIAVAAILAFRDEFPETPVVDVEILTLTKHIEISGGGQVRLYAWKDLGFTL